MATLRPAVPTGRVAAGVPTAAPVGVGVGVAVCTVVAVGGGLVGVAVAPGSGVSVGPGRGVTVVGAMVGVDVAAGRVDVAVGGCLVGVTVGGDTVGVAVGGAGVGVRVGTVCSRSLRELRAALTGRSTTAISAASVKPARISLDKRIEYLTVQYDPSPRSTAGKVFNKIATSRHNE